MLERIAAVTILSEKVDTDCIDQAIFVSIWAVASIIQARVQTQLILASQSGQNKILPWLHVNICDYKPDKNNNNKNK